MKISSAFPSNYLKAADLNGQILSVTIAKVILEQVARGNDQQPVVYFRGHQKGMVLNKTNAKKIAEVYGDDTDNWVGGEISLYEAMVEFQGDTVAALRIRHVPRKPQYAEPLQPKHEDGPRVETSEWDFAEATPPRPGPEPKTDPAGAQPSSLLVEAEAMTKQGIDAFRGWRDRLREDEYNALQLHMGRLVGMANQGGKPPMLSEAARKTLRKGKAGKPDEIQEDVF